MKSPCSKYCSKEMRLSRLNTEFFKKRFGLDSGAERIEPCTKRAKMSATQVASATGNMYSKGTFSRP